MLVRFLQCPLCRTSWRLCPRSADYLEQVNFRNKRGYTAVHYAALMGHLETCKALVKLGADLGATDIYGDQPIDRAEQAEKKNVEDWIAVQMKEAGIARKQVEHDGEVCVMYLCCVCVCVRWFVFHLVLFLLVFVCVCMHVCFCLSPSVRVRSGGKWLRSTSRLWTAVEGMESTVVWREENYVLLIVALLMHGQALVGDTDRSARRGIFICVERRKSGVADCSFADASTVSCGEHRAHDEGGQQHPNVHERC